MMKRMIVITKQQNEFLKEESKRLGVSANEIIRRCIDLYRGEIPLVSERSSKEKTEE